MADGKQWYNRPQEEPSAKKTGKQPVPSKKNIKPGAGQQGKRAVASTGMQPGKAAGKPAGQQSGKPSGKPYGNMSGKSYGNPSAKQSAKNGRPNVKAGQKQRASLSGSAIASICTS